MGRKKAKRSSVNLLFSFQEQKYEVKKDYLHSSRFDFSYFSLCVDERLTQQGNFYKINK